MLRSSLPTGLNSSCVANAHTILKPSRQCSILRVGPSPLSSLWGTKKQRKVRGLSDLSGVGNFSEASSGRCTFPDIRYNPSYSLHTISVYFQAAMVWGLADTLVYEQWSSSGKSLRVFLLQRKTQRGTRRTRYGNPSRYVPTVVDGGRLFGWCL